MDNFIVESMMFEHQIQCEIDQCFIEMQEYLFDENADIMLEETQNKKEGIITRLLRRIEELLHRCVSWLKRFAQKQSEIDKKIEKVEEQIESNPEIGEQQTDNFDIPKFTDEFLKEYDKSNKKPKRDVKSILEGCVAGASVMLPVVIGWVKNRDNERAIKKLEVELNDVKAELKAKRDYENSKIRELEKRDEIKERQKREDEYRNFQNKVKEEQENLKTKVDQQEKEIEQQRGVISEANQKITALTQALAIVQQEANKQIQVATTGKPSTTTTKHSGENTAPSTNGAPKTREEKNEAEHESREEQAKRIYTNYLDTIVTVWGNGATRKDVTNLANSTKSENDVVEKLKNINPKPNKPERIPGMIMILKRKASDYNELKNSASRKKS